MRLWRKVLIQPIKVAVISLTLGRVWKQVGVVSYSDFNAATLSI